MKRIVLLKLHQGIVNDAAQKSSDAASTNTFQKPVIGIQEHKAIEADILIIGTNSTASSPIEINGDPNVPVTRNNLVARSSAASAADNGSLVFNVEEDRPSKVYTRSPKGMRHPSQTRNSCVTPCRVCQKNKKIIHVTLRVPYDVVQYDDLTDATLATYIYYGFENYLC